MSFFCPHCGNYLLIDYPSSTQTKWFCRSCPYVANITQGKIFHNIELKKKEVDEILGQEQWNNSEIIDTIRCPKCHGKRAYFQMMQTRSADEPMSQFFKCVTCGHFWREG